MQEHEALLADAQNAAKPKDATQKGSRQTAYKLALREDLPLSIRLKAVEIMMDNPQKDDGIFLNQIVMALGIIVQEQSDLATSLQAIEKLATWGIDYKYRKKERELELVLKPLKKLPLNMELKAAIRVKAIEAIARIEEMRSEDESIWNTYRKKTSPKIASDLLMQVSKPDLRGTITDEQLCDIAINIEDLRFDEIPNFSELYEQIERNDTNDMNVRAKALLGRVAYSDNSPFKDRLIACLDAPGLDGALIPQIVDALQRMNLTDADCIKLINHPKVDLNQQIALVMKLPAELILQDVDVRTKVLSWFDTPQQIHDQCPPKGEYDNIPPYENIFNQLAEIATKILSMDTQDLAVEKAKASFFIRNACEILRKDDRAWTWEGQGDMISELENMYKQTGGKQGLAPLAI